jgi:hypothetical protein
MAESEESLDELLAKHPFRPQRAGPIRMPEYPPEIWALGRKMLEHRTRTGHKITDLFRK